MDRFLQKKDMLGELIQAGAAELYQRLQKTDVDSLKLPHHCLDYYKSSHSKRLFFSIETSAHLLYKSISFCGKPVSDIILMDYGAGVGTLYLLAKLIGCKKVIYNDHLDDWQQSAELIATAVEIKIDEYIVGDIDASLNRLDELNVRCDIVTSRNVIEHIYKLDVFYKALHEQQPQAIIYSSTTANKKNPASVLKHILWHRKWEKVFFGKRLVTIERQAPGMPSQRMYSIARATRGLAANDLKTAIDDFRETGLKPDPSIYDTNTCDPSNGVWAEHLISTGKYRQLIGENGFTVSFAPGFWDTHYKNQMMNQAGRLLNRIIAQNDSLAMWIAPFIYVIAVPASRK